MKYVYTDFSYDVHKKYQSKALSTRRVRSEINLFASQQVRATGKLPEETGVISDDDIVIINQREYCEAAEALKRRTGLCDL